jgi:hypothetical protein
MKEEVEIVNRECDVCYVVEGKKGVIELLYREKGEEKEKRMNWSVS